MIKRLSARIEEYPIIGNRKIDSSSQKVIKINNVGVVIRNLDGVLDLYVNIKGLRD